jgi:hypothetical protein
MSGVRSPCWANPHRKPRTSAEPSIEGAEGRGKARRMLAWVLPTAMDSDRFARRRRRPTRRRSRGPPEFHF